MSAYLQRLASAERVCHLSGRDGTFLTTDAEKATTQAWLEWIALHDCRDGFRGTAADQAARCLPAAERVCVLLARTGRAGAETADALKAWSAEYASTAAEVSDAEMLQLAARREVIQQRTLARLRREAEQEQARQRRLDFLECLYIEQGDQDTSGTARCSSPGGVP
ncbi:MAG TPA: hypothetical protein VF657_09915 [Actinoplanes sp.]|jgi:hypothetical protein